MNVSSRPNFWRLLYLSDTRLSSRKMFHSQLKKMFVFCTTFQLFGDETCVTEIRHATKIWSKIVAVKVDSPCQPHHPTCLSWSTCFVSLPALFATFTRALVEVNFYNLLFTDIYDWVLSTYLVHLFKTKKLRQETNSIEQSPFSQISLIKLSKYKLDPKPEKYIFQKISLNILAGKNGKG